MTWSLMFRSSQFSSLAEKAAEAKLVIWFGLISISLFLPIFAIDKPSISHKITKMVPGEALKIVVKCLIKDSLTLMKKTK